jgi:hypothetical protein
MWDVQFQHHDSDPPCDDDVELGDTVSPELAIDRPGGQKKYES